jgi:hypothetical protein
MFFWMVSITDSTQFEVVYCRWGHFPRLNKLMPMSVGKLSVRLSWTKKVLMTLQELCWLQIWTPQDTLTRQWKNLVWQLRHAPLIQINALIVATRDILVTTASNCMDILISGLKLLKEPRQSLIKVLHYLILLRMSRTMSGFLTLGPPTTWPLMLLTSRSLLATTNQHC